MFKKLYKKFDELHQLIKENFRSQSNEHCNTRSAISSAYIKHEAKLDDMRRVITSQQRTIEQLTNALCNKYEQGLFIFSEDCKIPMVIRNGEKIFNDRMTSFRIDWTRGEAPSMEIEMSPGTANDLIY